MACIAALQAAWALAAAGKCDLLILDEASAAYRYRLMDPSLLERLLFAKPLALELVLTGRDAPEALRQAADYITNMEKVRHPFDRGIAAREGIEY
jgi:cob(I)alamin adenosyltransferase